MIEKLYTVEEVAELASVTGRTIRNYLKSGRLVGRKIGGQWRFPEAEVQRLLTGGPIDDPEEPIPAPSGENTSALRTAPPRAANIPAEPESAYDEDYEISHGQNAPSPGPVQVAPRNAVYYNEPAPLPTTAPPAAPPEPPVQVQPQPLPQQAPAPQAPYPNSYQPYPQQTPQPPMPPSQPPAYGQPIYPAPVQAPAYYGGGQHPMEGPLPPQANPPAYPGHGYPVPNGGYQNPANYPPAQQPYFVPAAGTVYEPSLVNGTEPVQGVPSHQNLPMETAPIQEKLTSPAEAVEKIPAEGEGIPAVAHLSDVGNRVIKYISEVHDYSKGPQMCTVVDLHQSFSAARLTSQRLADIADEESESGQLCQSFVEFDERFYVARYTLFGTTSFLLRCLKLIG